MDRTEFHAFGDLIVAISQVLVKRLDPRNGILVSSSVDSSDASQSTKPDLNELVGVLSNLSQVPLILKSAVEFLEIHHSSLRISEDLLTLSDDFANLAPSLLRVMHEAVVLWFHERYSGQFQLLPNYSKQVDWGECPYGLDVMNIYTSLGGSPSTLFTQCLDYVTKAKDPKLKKKDLAATLEPRMITSVTPMKPKLSTTAITEASSSNATSSVNVPKFDPLGFTDASDFTLDFKEPNLDRPVADDRHNKSTGVMLDDKPIDWFTAFSFLNPDNYEAVFRYLESFYEIPTSFKVNANRPVNFDDLAAAIADFKAKPTIELVNPVLFKARTLRSLRVDPELLFEYLLGLIYPLKAKENVALKRQFLHYTSNRWGSNGYVLLAYWLCTNYLRVFGDFHFETPDELCQTKDESIFAFWNRICEQEHLFGEVEQSPDSLARNYERFISGLRDSIRRSVRGKLQSIYAFDNHEVRHMEEKARGVEHLSDWSFGISGNSVMDSSIKWLTLNESGYRTNFPSECMKSEAASSTSKPNAHRTPYYAKYSGSTHVKPRFKDKNRHSHEKPKATSSSETTASSSASDPSSSATPSKPKGPPPRDHGKNKKKE